MSLWVTDALALLDKPADDLNVEAMAYRCQEQTVHVQRMDFLKNIAGSMNAYRDACQAAFTALLAAHEIKIPDLGIKPMDDDHPKVKDDWERARQRRVKALEQRNERLANAKSHLADANKLAQACLDWRPDHLREKEDKSERKESAAVGGKAK